MALGQYSGGFGAIAGGIIGGLIGSFYGQTYSGAMIGASLGGMAGGVAGSVLWPEKISAKFPPPPQPNENRQQISTYGSPIPIVYESSRLAGNIIYMQDVNQTVTRSSHRQDGVRYYEITSTYASTFAIAFCEGPINGIARIFVNGKIFADYRDPNGEYYPSGSVALASANLSTSIARQATYFSLYLGSETQTADPTLVSLLTDAETPAYRGMCYIVFIDFPVGEFSGVPLIEVEIGTGVTIEFIDYSNSPSYITFGDFTADGYSTETLRLTGITQTYVGAHGANAMVDRLFKPVGTEIISFDYYHAADTWYDDDFTDAQCYVAIMPVDFSILTGTWNYGQPAGDPWIKMFMRKLTTSKVNVSTSVDGMIVDSVLSGLSSGLYDYNTYKFIIDWDNNNISVLVNGTSIVSSVAFSNSIKSSLGSSYRIIFHLHGYTSVPHRYFRNIIT